MSPMGRQHLDIHGRGLSQAEAQAGLLRSGPNALPEAAPPPLWLRFFRQFKSPLIYILLFALALDLALWIWNGAEGTPFESFAIAFVLVMNAGLGVFQEHKAESALSRLKGMAAPLVWAVRDHRLRQIPSREVVPGDVLRVEAGDRVGADGTLVAGHGVMTDEAILTGESLPVEKADGERLYSGTLMVRGKGYVEVTGTGPASTMGRLATMIAGIEAAETPLERRLAQFARQVALAILVLGFGLTVGGIVAEGWGRLAHAVLFSVALAVAAIPEGLPAVLTLTLALGVERLSRKMAIVRRMSAVEALGSVTVIATDKTGTLTENRMEVRDVATPDMARALLAMTLANDAEAATNAGDPLELALLAYAANHGADPKRLAAEHPRLSSRPFDSRARYMRVTVAEGDGPFSYFKGAPEVLLAMSWLSHEEKKVWSDNAHAAALQGYRVLALAYSKGERDDGLTFLGLVMLWDPPRPEAERALETARTAGIRVIMITGDHPATADAMARVIGLPTEGVMTGETFQGLTGSERRGAVSHINVFARASPEDKLAIVEALKANGEIVAVTGDGINDAPALKRADVGVAMGQRGSDVSREVADLVLMDDNLATIIAAIEEGRSIYENIQNIIRLMFSTNLALVLLIVTGLALSFVSGTHDPAGGLFLPLTAAQLLWINVVTDGPPALAMTLDRNPGVMLRPPRPAAARLLDDPSLRFIVATGIAKAAIGVALLIALPRSGYTLEETRTSVFLYELLAQLVFTYPARKISVVPLANPALHLAVAIAAVIQILTVVVPDIRVVLHLVPVDAQACIAIAGATALSFAVAEGLARHTAAGVTDFFASREQRH